MNLDLVLPDKTGLNEEMGYVLALVALELDNLAKLLVMHNIALALLSDSSSHSSAEFVCAHTPLPRGHLILSPRQTGRMRWGPGFPNQPCTLLVGDLGTSNTDSFCKTCQF